MNQTADHAPDCYAPGECMSCGCDKTGLLYGKGPRACVSHRALERTTRAPDEYREATIAAMNYGDGWADALHALQRHAEYVWSPSGCDQLKALIADVHPDDVPIRARDQA